MARPKLPCPTCGARDVALVMAVPAEDSGYLLVTLHHGGDRCEHARGRVTLAGNRAEPEQHVQAHAAEQIILPHQGRPVRLADLAEDADATPPGDSPVRGLIR